MEFDASKGQSARGDTILGVLEVIQKNELGDENLDMTRFLLLTPEGNIIKTSSKSAKDLEQKVRTFHDVTGIPIWNYDDDSNEGVDWVTFEEIWKLVKDVKVDAHRRRVAHVIHYGISSEDLNKHLKKLKPPAKGGSHGV